MRGKNSPLHSPNCLPLLSCQGPRLDWSPVKFLSFPVAARPDTAPKRTHTHTHGHTHTRSHTQTLTHSHTLHTRSHCCPLLLGCEQPQPLLSPVPAVRCSPRPRRLSSRAKPNGNTTFFFSRQLSSAFILIPGSWVFKAEPRRSSCSRTSLPVAAVGAERWDAELSGAGCRAGSESGARAALQTGNRRRNRPGRAEGREGKRRGARRSTVRVCLSASARRLPR